MKIKLSSYLFLLLPFIACSSNGSGTNEASVAEDVIIKNGNSLLWKVEGEGIKTSYFFGTMHIINEEFYHFSDRLTERIASSDALVMEIGGMPNPLKTFQMMTLDSGTVHSYFSSEQLIELLEFMDKQLGISPQEFDQTYGGMKPFFILQAISQAYFEPQTKSYDLTIMGIASEKEIPLIGLETMEEQLGFFDQIPAADMANMIMESTKDFETERENTLKLMKYYSEQKVDKLIPLLQKQAPEFMEFADLFLYNRNRAWVPKLEKEMADKSCFVAVGAGHLFGENGLIDLFQKKGYTLTAISMDE